MSLNQATSAAQQEARPPCCRKPRSGKFCRWMPDASPPRKRHSLKTAGGNRHGKNQAACIDQSAMCVAGQAHALDGEAASPTLSPGEVTSAAQQEMHFSGGGKPQNAIPAPLYAGGNPPSMMASPVPSNGSNNSPSPYPSDPAAYIHVSASCSSCATPMAHSKMSSLVLTTAWGSVLASPEPTMAPSNRVHPILLTLPPTYM